MKVRNIINNQNRAVANQFIIEDKDKVVFQSYETIICNYNKNTHTLTLNNDWWDYSNTTRKYFKQFVNEETCFTYETKAQFIKIVGFDEFGEMLTVLKIK